MVPTPKNNDDDGTRIKQHKYTRRSDIEIFYFIGKSVYFGASKKLV